MKCYSTFSFMCMTLLAVNYDSVNFKVPRFTHAVFVWVCCSSFGGFPSNPPVSSTIGGTNKTYPNDITEILLKLALSTIKQTNKHIIPNLPFLCFPTFPS